MAGNPRIKVGAQLFAQVADWPTLLDAAQRLDALPYDYLFLPDHLVGLSGTEPNMFEGYTTLAALAAVTEHPRLALLVGANTFRNPAYAAKMVATIDNISDGRAMLGLGAGWHEREHQAYGIDFGASPGMRLRWMDEALTLLAPLLAGETVSHRGPRYATDSLVLSPKPVQSRVPIMIGGVGERRTLPAVARFADVWNAQVGLAGASHKIDVLERHCAAIGRDIAEIELSIDCRVFIRDTADLAWSALERNCRAQGMNPPAVSDEYFWVGSPTDVAARIADYYRLGFRAVVSGFIAPYDEESMQRLVTEAVPQAMHMVG